MVGATIEALVDLEDSGGDLSQSAEASAGKRKVEHGVQGIFVERPIDFIVIIIISGCWCPVASESGWTSTFGCVVVDEEDVCSVRREARADSGQYVWASGDLLGICEWDTRDELILVERKGRMMSSQS